jgi:hypothetical protein
LSAPEAEGFFFRACDVAAAGLRYRRLERLEVDITGAGRIISSQPEVLIEAKSAALAISPLENEF